MFHQPTARLARAAATLSSLLASSLTTEYDRSVTVLLAARLASHAAA